MSYIRILMVLSMICVLPLTGIAENKEERIFYAMDSFQNWMEVVQEKQKNIQDKDSLYITSEYLNTMMFMKSVLLNSNMVTIQEESKFPVFSWKETEEENGTLVTLQTDTCRMASGNKYSCQAVYTDEYYQMSLYTFDQDDKPTGKNQIEIARKENELLVVLLSYNAELDIISRFATWYSGTAAKTVYTQVFGSEMDIVLKPKDWCEGKQIISEFSKDLLLPVQS